MSDPLKAALDAASRALCFGPNGCDCSECVDPKFCMHSGEWRSSTAAAITAFLRAMPAVDVMYPQRPHDPVDPGGPHSTWTLAAAVERAAGGGE